MELRSRWWLGARIHKFLQGHYYRAMGLRLELQQNPLEHLLKPRVLTPTPCSDSVNLGWSLERRRLRTSRGCWDAAGQKIILWERLSRCWGKPLTSEGGVRKWQVAPVTVTRMQLNRKELGSWELGLSKRLRVSRGLNEMDECYLKVWWPQSLANQVTLP